jgi:hypothetical protein
LASTQGIAETIIYREKWRLARDMLNIDQGACGQWLSTNIKTPSILGIPYPAATA